VIVEPAALCAVLASACRRQRRKPLLRALLSATLTMCGSALLQMPALSWRRRDAAIHLRDIPENAVAKKISA
jgi:hypothetical protein